MTVASAPVSVPDLAFAWSVVREVARCGRVDEPLVSRTGFCSENGGAARTARAEEAALWVDPLAEPCFGSRLELTAEVSTFLNLYLPLCLGASSRELVVAHLGQSLDGQIATSTGESRYVTSNENLRHLHRLRALCDAVVVGASTVERDDPKLTTRLVAGENPARVVIDPGLRTLTAGLWSDRAARSILVCEAGAARERRPPDSVEVIELPEAGRNFSPARIVAALKARGLSRLLVEGGGVTVSRFIDSRVAQRLHLCVAPLLLGCGRPGLMLPPIQSMQDATRVRVRRFDLGEDTLFDCEWRPAATR